MGRRFKLSSLVIAASLLCMFFITSYRVGRAFSPCVGGAWLCASFLSVAAVILTAQGKLFRNYNLRCFTSKSCNLWLTFVFLTLVSAFILTAVLWLCGIKLSRQTQLTAELVSAALLMTVGLFESGKICVTKLKIETEKLPPEIKKLRIAALSDLHIGLLTGDGHIDKVVQCVKDAKPDMLLIAGDIADVPIPKSESKSAALRSITAPLGVFAVLGNHDSYGGRSETEAFARASGIEIIENECREVGGIVIEGAGDMDHDVPYEIGLSRSEELIVNTKNRFREKFIILLRHRPVVETCTQGLFDLQISGHTHGGQAFPLPHSRLKIRGHSRGFKRLLCGSLIYTTNGVGCTGAHVRLFSPPEIVIIDLVNKNETKQKKS